MSFNEVEKQLKKDIEKATELRDARCLPVAKDIIILIGNSEPVMACTDSKIIADTYTPTTEQILTLLLEKNVNVDDVGYIFSLVFEHFEHCKNFTEQSLSRSLDKVSDKLWGKDTKEVTMSDVDEVLRR